MGLNPPLIGIQRYAQAKWGSKGFKLAHQMRGVFLFKFHSEEDMLQVLNEAPWHYFECPLLLQLLSPKRDIDPSKVKELSLWVRFPNLRLYLWTEEVLSKIGSEIGTPLCIDDMIEVQGRLDYARICIQEQADHELQKMIPVIDLDGKDFNQ